MKHKINAQEKLFSSSHKRLVALYMYACVMVFVASCVEIVMQGV